MISTVLLCPAMTTTVFMKSPDTLETFQYIIFIVTRFKVLLRKSLSCSCKYEYSIFRGERVTLRFNFKLDHSNITPLVLIYTFTRESCRFDIGCNGAAKFPGKRIN